jgi:hypothetical protein
VAEKPCSWPSGARCSPAASKSGKQASRGYGTHVVPAAIRRGQRSPARQTAFPENSRCRRMCHRRSSTRRSPFRPAPLLSQRPPGEARSQHQSIIGHFSVSLLESRLQTRTQPKRKLFPARQPRRRRRGSCSGRSRRVISMSRGQPPTAAKRPNLCFLPNQEERQWAQDSP